MAEALAERLVLDLRLTGGTMRLIVVVADDAERAEAMRILAGKRHARLLTIETRAENDVRWRRKGVV
jgi:hypothetical protein